MKFLLLKPRELQQNVIFSEIVSSYNSNIFECNYSVPDGDYNGFYIFCQAYTTITCFLSECDIVHDSIVGLVRADETTENFEHLIPLDLAEAGSVLGMLMLAFPEIHWIPLYPGQEATFKQEIEKVVKLAECGYTPLFNGFDEQSRIFRLLGSDYAGYAESKSAVTIDDEVAYAYFSAYAAYRQGYGVIPIFTRGLMNWVEKWSEDKRNLSFDLITEDICLEFPDDTSNKEKLKWGIERDTEFSFLKRAANRWIVSSYKEKKQNGCIFWQRWIRKPFCSIFEFTTGEEIKLRQKGQSTQKQSNNHAAPGVLAHIASRLLRRAEQMEVDGILDVESAIHAAVLANLAYKLLRDKTPTLVVEALMWQQHFEVLAECQFAGVKTSSKYCKKRLRDIRGRIKAIVKVSNDDGDPRTRDDDNNKMFYHGMVRILHNIGKVLNEHDRYREELYYLAQSRRYQRRELPWPLRFLLLYPEVLLRGWAPFVGCTLLLFSIICLFTINLPIEVLEERDLLGQGAGMYYMLLGDVPDGVFECCWEWVTGLHALRLTVGLHIGILVTQFYNYMIRK